MSTILFLAAAICGFIAAMLGFGWFGTSQADALGWLGLSVTFIAVAFLLSAVDFPAVRWNRNA